MSSPGPRTYMVKKGQKGVIPEGLRRYQDDKRRAREEGIRVEAAEEATEETGALTITGELAVFARAIESAQKEKDSAAALDKIKSAFGQLSDEDQRRLIATDQFQRLIETKAREAGTPAGTVVHDNQGRPVGKVPWSARAIKELYPEVTFVPTRTRPVTFNGVRTYMTAGVPWSGPSIYQDIYMQCEENDRRQQQDAIKILQDSFGPSVSLVPGAMGPRELPEE